LGRSPERHEPIPPAFALASYGSAQPAFAGPSAVAELTPSVRSFCVELAAGLQFDFGPHFGIKAGFQYIDSINNVRLFNTDANTDTKALEAGVVFRY
jgi:hypothetical protein